ncbi:Phosphotidylinositol phosphatase PTPRQ [Cricetulus griseus]|uniref:Phosphotidylinositol phosphatase PTPRQ n=1 Tax=Cricetulus griseus TaxID=10029 RepID=G3IIL9_CRIGR|nr:Phosphotidylinositol phosphatase PTPRQ [Cricetulus griseus]
MCQKVIIKSMIKKQDCVSQTSYKEVCPWMQTAYTRARAKPDSLEVLLTNLNPGTTYEIKVAAENSAGIGVFSDPFLFQTAESVPEGPPQNCVTGNVTGKAFSISWDPPTIVTGKFSYRVELYGPSVPGAVFDLQITEVEATEIRITWRKPRQPNGIINQYRVKVSVLETGVLLENTLLIGQDEVLEGSEIKSSSFHCLVTTKNQYITDITAEQLSYVIRRLVPFTEHTVSVSAFTIMGEGPPTVLTVRTRLKKYTRYKMRVAASTHVGEGSLSEENDIFVRTPEDGLKKYTHYVIEVSASTLKGEGIRSLPISILTEEDAPDSPPQNFSVKQLSGVTVMLSWQPPLEPNGIILYYTVYVW